MDLSADGFRVVGYEDTLKYIYDFLLKDGPFDVSRLKKHAPVGDYE